MRIIQGKMKGKKVTLDADEEPRQAEVVDLMERLRQSLAGRRRARRPRNPAKSPPSDALGARPDIRADCRVQIADLFLIS